MNYDSFDFEGTPSDVLQILARIGKEITPEFRVVDTVPSHPGQRDRIVTAKLQLVDKQGTTCDLKLICDFDAEGRLADYTIVMFLTLIRTGRKGDLWKKFAPIFEQTVTEVERQGLRIPQFATLSRPRNGSPVEVWIHWYHQQRSRGHKVTLREVAEKSGYSYGYVRQRHAGCSICDLPASVEEHKFPTRS